jgi:xeroderma pigmentosum group C-complementing protein
MEENSEAFVDVSEFREKASSCEGSADYGAQLFCSLLRALGVETRLACSLQVFPFTSAGTVQTPSKDSGKRTIYLEDHDEDIVMDEAASSLFNNQSNTPKRIARLGHRDNRFEEPPRQVRTSVTRRSPRPVARPRHPIFWVEVFDSAYQKWIPVDPLATGSMGKPTSLEPGLSDAANLMSYVISFEESGVAKDVTRRYTKAYIAKTRKFRVEFSEKGERWLSRAMKPFKRGRILV